MRIAHVLPALTKGGGERVAADLANAAVSAGHEVSVLAAFPVDPSLLQDTLSPQVDVRFVIGRSSAIGKYLATPLWFWRHRKWLDQQDVVHCHMTFGAVIGAMVQMRRALGGPRGPVVVETYHAVGMPIPKINRWLHARMAMSRDALAIMAEDAFWLRVLHKRPAQTSKLIPNGIAARPSVSASEAALYRLEIGVPATCDLVVGTVGRLAPERRPDLFVPLFAEISRELGSGVHFIVGGEGPELKKLQRLINDVGLADRVHLPGLVRRPEVAQAAMDLYFTLNVGDVTGVAALEAALCGIPVVGLQLLDGHPPREDMFIWSSHDHSAVAERAISLLKNVTARRELASVQKAYVEAHHTVEAMAQAYEQLYITALEKALPRLPSGRSKGNSCRRSM